MLETSLTNLSGGMLEIGRCVPALWMRIGELPNVEIRTQITTTAVRTRSTEARIYLSDGHQISCKLLIAADGRDSEIRRAFQDTHAADRI